LAGNIVVVMCAVVITAMAVRREFFPAGRSEFRFRADAVHDTAWAEISSRGHQLGSSSGIVTIVEFGDFQCPACRDFARSALRGALAAFPQELQVLYRHWPLTYHEHAYAAALAAECAAAQGRFKEYHDLLHLKQDSIGASPSSRSPSKAGCSTQHNSPIVGPTEKRPNSYRRISIW